MGSKNAGLVFPSSLTTLQFLCAAKIGSGGMAMEQLLARAGAT